MHLTPLPWLLAATPLLTAETLEYRQPERLHYAFETTQVLASERMSLAVGDSAEMTLPGFDVLAKRTVRVTDELLERGPRFPAKFRRYMDQALLEVDVEVPVQGGKPKKLRLDATGGMEGKSVVFTWVPEENEYGRYYDDEEGVEEELPNLEARCDFAAFLPEGPVEVGTEWEVDPRAFRSFLGPCGSMGFDLRPIGDLQLARTLRLGLGTHMHELFAGDVRGRLTARFEGRREVEGRSLGVIALTADLEARADLADRAMEYRTQAERELGIRPLRVDVSLSLDGEGELLWDLEGGHLAASSFEADEELSVELEIGTTRAEGDEAPERTRQAARFEGKLRHAATVERGEVRGRR